MTLDYLEAPSGEVLFTLNATKAFLQEKSQLIAAESYRYRVGLNQSISELSEKILRDFYGIKGINSPPLPSVVSVFADEIFEELPPCDLEIPFSVVEEWYSRLESPIVATSSKAIEA